MASPFRAFRKHQKTLIVIAGVVLMFVFVLSQPLTQYLSGHGGGEAGGRRLPNSVAVQWKGGSLTNAELRQLVQRRLVLNNFLRQVAIQGQQMAEEAGRELQPLGVELLIHAERPEQGVEQDVVRTQLFADAARKAGMTVSDEFLVNYLHQIGRGYVSPGMLREMVASMQSVRGVSVDYLLDALRDEMLARNYLASYFYAFETELPESRWRDWLRVNDRVVVEAMPVTAESLLVDVKNPSEDELRAFYNEYKDIQPMPDRSWGIELPSPNPAFAIPQKVATQFLVADYNQFLAKVEDEVTDEEIEKFYEDNKDPMFIRAESVLSSPDDLMNDEPENGTAEKADVNEPNPKAVDSSSPEKSPEKGNTEENGAKENDSKPAPATNDGSSLARTSPFRLTAFAEDAPAESEASPAANEPAGAEAPTAELAAPTAEKPKDFQPLDEVRDQIRRSIASTKVTEKLEELMSTVKDDLEASYYQYFGASLDAEEAGKEPPPPPAALADLTPLSEKYGLEYKKTELASLLELQDTPIGNSVRRDQGNIPFYYSVFSRDVELYQPILTYDLDNNRYVAMKTQEVPGKVPTFEEVRDEVAHAWKLREAGKLAVTRAEELAKQAQDHGGTLAEAFADDDSHTVVKTDPFAFLTIGEISRETQQVQSFRLSEPAGIAAAGPEFMEKIFELKENEVGAAPNHDHSIAYVVRVAEHQNTPAELQQAFLAEDNNWYGAPAWRSIHFQNSRIGVVSDMLKSYEIDWKRNPDEVIRSDESDDQDQS